jgi:hypothetical protein
MCFTQYKSRLENNYLTELIAKYKRMLLRQSLLLVFTTLVCLRIQQLRHAKAVNTNLSNQLNRGNFEIASTIWTLERGSGYHEINEHKK